LKRARKYLKEVKTLDNALAKSTNTAWFVLNI